MATRKATMKAPQDDHVLLLIAGHQQSCKAEILPVIGRAQQTAERSHERLDEHLKEEHKEVNDRLFRMDDTEVGKVTILWSERNKIIAVGGILLLGIVINIMVGVLGGAKIDKNTLKEAVKEALTQVKP